MELLASKSAFLPSGSYPCGMLLLIYHIVVTRIVTDIPGNSGGVESASGNY